MKELEITTMKFLRGFMVDCIYFDNVYLSTLHAPFHQQMLFLGQSLELDKTAYDVELESMKTEMPYPFLALHH